MPLLMFFDLMGRMVFREILLGDFDRNEAEEEQEGPVVNAQTSLRQRTRRGAESRGLSEWLRRMSRRLGMGRYVFSLLQGIHQLIQDQQEKNADNEMKGEASAQPHDAERRDPNAAEKMEDAMSIGA